MDEFDAMAMSGGATSGSFGKRRHRRRPVMSEINVTPMVDVMLVLLIIFMVSAPLMINFLESDLPEGKTGTPASNMEARLNITLKRTAGACSSQSELYLGDTPVRLADLERLLKEAKTSSKNELTSVGVIANRETCHVDYSRVLDSIRAAGLRAKTAILPQTDDK